MAAASRSVTRSAPPAPASSARRSRSWPPCLRGAAPSSASAPTAARAAWRCWKRLQSNRERCSLAKPGGKGFHDRRFDAQERKMADGVADVLKDKREAARKAAYEQPLETLNPARA